MNRGKQERGGRISGVTANSAVQSQRNRNGALGENGKGRMKWVKVEVRVWVENRKGGGAVLTGK